MEFGECGPKTAVIPLVSGLFARILRRLFFGRVLHVDLSLERSAVLNEYSRGGNIAVDTCGWLELDSLVRRDVARDGPRNYDNPPVNGRFDPSLIGDSDRSRRIDCPVN